jgi:lysophospholipase L1-like esterase
MSKRLTSLLKRLSEKHKNCITNFFLLSITLVFCLIIIEFLSGRLYHKITPERGRIAIDALLLESTAGLFNSTGRDLDNNPISEIEILPYYLYRNKPFSKIENIQQINSEGYRNGAKEFEKKKNTIRIIAIGGSTTFGWLIKDYRETWPTQLEEILNKKFNNKIEVINAGLPGGMSSESLVAFIMKDKYLDPDIVIFHNGGNDMVPLLYDKYYPDYKYHRAIIGADKLRPGERNLIIKSNFVKLFYAFWIRNAQLSSVRSAPEEKVELKEAILNVKKHSAIGFERNMETLIREVKSIGAEPVIFPFHLASDEVYKLIPESMRYAQQLHPAMILGIEKNKAVLKSLAIKYNIPYHEIEAHKIPLENFFDHTHVKPQGEKIKAEFIAQYIIPIIEKRIVK